MRPVAAPSFARPPNAERNDGDALSEPDFTPRASRKHTRQVDMAAPRGKPALERWNGVVFVVPIEPIRYVAQKSRRSGSRGGHFLNGGPDKFRWPKSIREDDPVQSSQSGRKYSDMRCKPDILGNVVAEETQAD